MGSYSLRRLDCTCAGPGRFCGYPPSCGEPEYRKIISECKALTHNCVCNIFYIEKKLNPWSYCRSTTLHVCTCYKVFSKFRACRAQTHSSLMEKLDNKRRLK